jgi:hypothetical protein
VPRFSLWLLAAVPLILAAQVAPPRASSTISGDVVGADGKPSSKPWVWWESATDGIRVAAVRADEYGHFVLHVPPGSYRVCAVPVAAEDAGSTHKAPISTCFPSVSGRDRQMATVVRTTDGESVGPIRISLREENVYSIEGKIITRVPRSADYSASAATTRAYAISQHKSFPIGGVTPESDFNAFGRVNRKGTRFTIHGLPAGDYVVVVETGVAKLACDTCDIAHLDTAQPVCDACDPPRFRYVERVHVDRDIKNMIAIIYPNTSVTGHVIVEDKDQPLLRPQIDLDPGVPFQLWPRTSAFADGSGSFHIDRLPPGDYAVHAWERQYYMTVRQDGKEVPGNLIRIVPGSSPDLEVVLRRATATIRVQVKQYWKYPCVFAVPEDAWDDTASWIVTNSSLNGTNLLQARAGAYLVMAVNLPFFSRTTSCHS